MSESLNTLLVSRGDFGCIESTLKFIQAEAKEFVRTVHEGIPVAEPMDASEQIAANGSDEAGNARSRSLRRGVWDRERLAAAFRSWY
jgi:hypothetical protein